jgi:hypothetical protein
MWRDTQRIFITQVSFNSHTAHHLFLAIVQLFCVQKTCKFTILTIYTFLHINSIICENVLLNKIITLRLVKLCM